MQRLDTKERFVWLACGLLGVAWAIAAVTNFDLNDKILAVPASRAETLEEYRLLFLGATFVVIGIVLAWFTVSFASAEIRKQAAMERRYRVALEEVHRGTLQALTSALDLRDGETYGHSRRVMGFSLAIGRRVGLDARQMQTLAWGALLHDLGKIGIRDEILLKPGPLTPEERASMNEHAIIGHQMAQNISFLSRAATVIRHHHERFDGAGYPDRLKGEEIPLLARIFAVADSFDAMTSSRPYRPVPLTIEAAMKIIQEEAGRQFCPISAAAFVSIPSSELEQIRATSFAPMDDLGALVRLDEEVENLAPSYYRDPLTGIQNRAAWEAKKAEMTLVRGKELGTVVFLDLDRLKQVNDSQGHLAGDRILADLGARLIQLSHDAYRFGGDEFLLWFPAGAWNIGTQQALTDTLSHFAASWAHVFQGTSVSWGASTATAESTSVTALLEEADSKMYAHKVRRQTPA